MVGNALIVNDLPVLRADLGSDQHLLIIEVFEIPVLLLEVVFLHLPGVLAFSHPLQANEGFQVLEVQLAGIFVQEICLKVQFFLSLHVFRVLPGWATQMIIAQG